MHMNNPRFLLLLVATLFVVPGCARDTGDAGVKPIGVGFDPGDLFPGPEERGGVIDLVQINTRGANLDFGVTGFFGSGGSFTNTNSDPFDAVLHWGWFFSPALLAADEYSALSPKGPDLEGACFVQQNSRGPLGTFKTVDVGDEIVFTNAHEDPALRTRFAVPRTPQDYPVNSSSVFIYYVGTSPVVTNDPILAPTWAYGQDIQMQFSGALPPQNAPVASIPLPSDAADEAVGKAAGHPTVFSPHELTGISVSNRSDDDGQVELRYAPTSSGLPNFLGNDGVLHVAWDIDDTLDYSDSHVTITILLLREADEGSLVEDPFGGETFCLPAVPLPIETTRDEAWFAEYNYRKEFWCDVNFEPDLEIGNDEFGLDNLGQDTCHNGEDDDEDGRCDEGGCYAVDGAWLLPDPNCARHVLETAVCGNDGHCRPVGGDRGADGHIAELLCTAEDNGDFVVPSTMIQELMTSVDPNEVVGAVLKVARTSEVLVEVPTVRDQVGNTDNINPVRLRASQVYHGRFDWGE
jgi:hypothetical protein